MVCGRKLFDRQCHLEVDDEVLWQTSLSLRSPVLRPEANPVEVDAVGVKQG